MYVIGERINGMFNDVRDALKNQDKGVIQDLAERQVECGADCLDVNVGPGAADAVSAMAWLVESIREVTDAPLAIDSTKPDAITAGVEAAGGKAVINSTTGEQAKMEKLFPIAAEHGCAIIGLTIDENGVPHDAAGRMEVALKLLAGAMEHGIAAEDLYIDAVILPVNAQQTNPGQVMETIRQTKLLADPPPKTVVGLSNVSQGARHRELINRTALVMCLAGGLDAAIVDPMDSELMDAMITAEVLLNKAVYCDDFLKAYRRKT